MRTIRSASTWSGRSFSTRCRRSSWSWSASSRLSRRLRRNRQGAMRKVSELVMYGAFAAAALPTLWLDVQNVLYFRAHPEMLEERDSSLEAMAVAGFLPVMAVFFAAGCVLALYFLATGPRAARVSIAVLAVVYVAILMLTPRTPFASFARVYLDGACSLAFFALPLVCAAWRARTGWSAENLT